MASGEHYGAIFDAGTTLGLDPAELLARFAGSRDEAAFAALVAHHGPMVLATCRRILPHGLDADDAFQATFLVLARHAGSIRDPDRLAPWLHGVARRVATRARAQAAKRRALAGEAAADELETVASAPPRDDLGDLRAVLDEELARLPAKYRAPLVLCYLEGLTHDQAAGQLKWPVGTVRSRLAGGRDRLRSRLARRGFAPGSIGLPAPLPLAVVSGPLRVATVRLALAANLPSAAAPAAILAQGVLTAMFVTKVQTAALATLAVAATLAAGTAGVVLARQQAAPQSAPGAAPPPARIAPDAGAESPEEELYRRTQALNQLGAQAARATGPARADLDEKLKQATQRFWSARLNGEVADNYAWEMTGVPGKLQSQIGRAEVFVKELTGELDAAKGRVKALRAELSAWQAKHQPSEANYAVGAAGAIAQQPSADVPKVGPPSPTAAEPPEVAALKARIKALEAEVAKRDEAERIARELAEKRLAQVIETNKTIEAIFQEAKLLLARPETARSVPQRVDERLKGADALRKEAEALKPNADPAELAELAGKAGKAGRLGPIGGNRDLTPSRPADGAKEAGQVRPEAAPTVKTLKGSPTILMVTPASLDRVTMVNLQTRGRATLRFSHPLKTIRALENTSDLPSASLLGGASAAGREENKQIEGLIGLALAGERIEQVAVFDRHAMRWFEHDLPQPAAAVYPDMDSSSCLVGFGVHSLRPTQEGLVFDAKDRTWTVVTLPEAVEGDVPASSSGYGTVAFDLGPRLALYSRAARKSSVLELTAPTTGRQNSRNMVGIRQFDERFGHFDDGKLIVPDGDLIRVFDPRTAEWATISTADDK